MVIPRYKASAGAALLAVLLTGCAALASPTTEGVATSSIAPTASVTPEITLTDAERISSAEAAAEAELPDAPIWKGMTFAGVAVNASEICVDRTWNPGGGPDDQGGSAGYVVVAFPEVVIGDPESGLCTSYAPSEEKSPVIIEVPSTVSDDPGLLVSSTFGDSWPLTIPYALVRCEEITEAGRTLQLATLIDPDGKTYAANGTAKDHGGYLDIDPIWAENPDFSNLKIDISPVIDAALDHCN